MSRRLCPRCEKPLPSEAEGALLFCPACGAPQVRVSEQLLEEIAERRHTRQDAAAASVVAEGRSTGRDVLRTAALVGAIAAALAATSLVLPPVVLLLWLWVLGAPILALGLYVRRRRDTEVSPSFGAQLGFLSGVSVVVALLAIDTLSLLLARFAFHRSALVDVPIAAVFTQVHTATVAQYGAAAAAPFVGLLAIPEFRAGLLLASVAMFSAAYLVLTTAGGAFAGLLRQRGARR